MLATVIGDDATALPQCDVDVGRSEYDDDVSDVSDRDT